MLGVLLANGCIVTINPANGDAGLAPDIRDLRVPVGGGGQTDWQRPGVVDAAAGALGLRVMVDPAGCTAVAGPRTARSGSIPRRARWHRGRDAHQRHHRPTQADPAVVQVFRAHGHMRPEAHYGSGQRSEPDCDRVSPSSRHR